MRPSPVTSLWIFLCAWLNCAGWILSSCHALNIPGYLLVFALGALVVWACRQSLCLAPSFAAFRGGKLSRRFRRLFPASFVVLASLALLGGILHPPANFDALAYRVPRILHWLAEQQWHWIHTDFPRLNTRICGIEWVSAPLILFTKTDRLLFVINAISYLLLPGLVFGLLRNLGVSGRAAWHWMWLFPGAYGFLLQAGSIANDMYGAVFGLAAIDYALRARRTGRTSFALLSILSAALLTSAKSSNLPLLLPWLIALAPSWRLLVARPFATVLAGLLAAGASFLPTAALNLKHCGDWTGLNIESAIFRDNQPVFRIVVNTGLLLTQNLAPPIFPLASHWNAFTKSHIPPGLAERLQNQFEPSAAHFGLGEMQMEETAGLGCGLTVLLLLTLAGQWFYARDSRKSRAGSWLAFYVIAGTWAAALVFMVKSGLSPAARYLIPHYVLLAAPILLTRWAGQITRAKWWRVAAMCHVAMAIALVVATPPRPLWPAVSLLRKAGAENSTSRLIQRAWAVYSVYGGRADAFAPARKLIPPGASPIGLVTFDDPETSLWRPFGSRRILHVTRNDTGTDLREKHIKYALVSTAVLSAQYQTTIAAFLRQLDARTLHAFPLTLRAGVGATEWHLVEIGDSPNLAKPGLPPPQ